MGVLTYTAKRNVIATHTLGLTYNIETAFQIIDDTEVPIGTEREMLDKVTVEYELDGARRLVTVQSDEIVEADFELWREFLTSVHAREQFNIDLTGTIAVPGTVLNCKLYRGNFAPNRTGPGIQQYKQTFTVRIL